MRLLLDTHAFLWFILDDRRLSERAKSLISSGDNSVEISPASYGRSPLRMSHGKYALPEPYADFMEREGSTNDFGILPIEPKHTALLTDLLFHRRDPFDRLLVAQAQAEKVPLVSADPVLDACAVTRIW